LRLAPIINNQTCERNNKQSGHECIVVDSEKVIDKCNVKVGTKTELGQNISGDREH